MSARDRLLRLLGLEVVTGATGARLFSEDLYGIRPGVAIGPRGDAGTDATADGKPYRMVADGIAEVRIEGVLSKRPDLFRWLGLSEQPTLPEMGAAVRAAAADSEVRGILLLVDSPGGSVLGTLEVAQAVAAAQAKKPVHAYGRDEIASCAYWIGSQAGRVTTNAVAHVGAIGVYSVLLDASEAAGAAGLRFVVVKSGEFKGAGMPGTEITDGQLAYFQSLIDDCNAEFKAAVASGRAGRLSAAQVNEVADGRCHIGAKAAALGLTDGVGTYQDALAVLVAEVGAAEPRQPDEPAVDLPPEGAEPEEELPGQPSGETTVSKNDDTKPDPTGEADEERSFVRRLMGLLKGETEKVAEPAPAVTAEQVAKMVESGVNARMAAQEVNADLRQFEGKATPAAIAKARPVLLKAKTAGDEETYAALLGVLAEQDASYLLDGEIASAEETSEGAAHAVSGRAEVMARNGIDAKREAELTRKYGLSKAIQ